MAETKTGSLAAALAKLQAELPTVGKDSRADTGSYSYSYADLEACSKAVMPVMAKHGLSFSAKPTFVEGAFRLVYTLRHDSGESDTGEYPLPDPARANAQQIGSAISYGRRYSLCAITGLAPGGEDDDGKSAADAHAAAERREREEREAEERKRAESQKFIAEFVPRIDGAKDTVEIAALEAEAKRRFQGGVITSADARTLKDLLDERAAAIASNDEQTEIPV